MYFFTAIKFIDESLFLTINQLPHPPVLDLLFLAFSYNPLVIWMGIGLLVLTLNRGKSRRIFVQLLLALVLAGGLASVLIKPLVGRPRPDITYGEQVIVVKEKPAGIPAHEDFAFPSGHAALAWAGAFVLASQFKLIKKHKSKVWIFYTLAILTSISRIYLGKHYPLDVLAGGLIGWCMGWLAGIITQNIYVILQHKKILRTA